VETRIELLLPWWTLRLDRPHRIGVGTGQRVPTLARKSRFRDSAEASMYTPRHDRHALRRAVDRAVAAWRTDRTILQWLEAL
jgi:hypothetical protein